MKYCIARDRDQWGVYDTDARRFANDERGTMREAQGRANWANQQIWENQKATIDTMRRQLAEFLREHERRLTQTQAVRLREIMSTTVDHGLLYQSPTGEPRA